MHNAQRESSGWHPNDTSDLPLDPFFLNPRNQRFFLGRTRYPAIRGRDSILIVLLLLIVFIAVLGVELHQQAGSIWLARYGKTASGTILERNKSGGKTTTYRLTFQYQITLPDKKLATYQHTQEVSGGVYTKHLPGSAVSIVYQSDDPTMAELGGVDSDSHYYDSQLLFSGLFVLFVFGELVYLLVPIYKDSVLADKGSITPGEIIESYGVLVRRKQRYYRLTVTYVFVSPTTGEHLIQTQTMRRDDLRSEGQRKNNINLVEVGTPVAVLYLDDKHFTML